VRSQKLLMALPYAVLFAVVAWFYWMAAHIEFTQRGNNVGPDFWPRMALAAMMIICFVQVVRLTIFGAGDHDTGVIDTSDDEDDDAPRSTPLLLAGLVLTVAYGLAMPILGFLISTFLFMVLFMYVGQYREHLTVFVTSLVGAVMTTIIFQKVVYVSLPRGIPPFDQVADLIFKLF
jgi:putative tricarboxylic transport membrane protein